MNQLPGTITEVQSNESLSLVRMRTPGNVILTALIIDNAETAGWLIPGKNVNIYFKEIEVMISSDPSLKISAQNRLPCTIRSVKTGALLAQIELLFHGLIITSIITANACRQLNLREADEVIAVIKTNEISISPDD
jgi:molybdate transport system regulatory protein